MKRTLIPIILIILILAAASAAYLADNSSSTTEAPPLIDVRRGTIKTTVDASGTVYADREVEIKAKASGEIVELPFDVGDRVRKGDLLVRLDPIDEQRSLRKAEIATSSTLARLAQARIDVSTAERNLASNRSRAAASLAAAEATAVDRRRKAERALDLYVRKLASEQERDEAVSAAATADSEVEGARIRLTELDTEELTIERLKRAVELAEADRESARISQLDARERLAETQIYAPIDGVVSELNVQVGQIISSAISNVGGGTSAMVLSDLGRMFVYASVDETDVGKLALGQTVTVRADGYGDEEFVGKVERIAVKGEEVSNVVTFEAGIQITSANRTKLKPQMTVTASILLEEHSDVTVVANEALIEEGGRTFVEVQGSGNATARRVITTGLTDGVDVEVLTGLQPGERVVSQGTIKSRWTAKSEQKSSLPPPPGL